MKHLKYAFVVTLDWIDDTILKHRYYKVCHFVTITLESWWGPAK